MITALLRYCTLLFDFGRQKLGAPSSGFFVLVGVLGGAVVLAGLMAVSIGSVSIPLAHVWQIVASQLGWGESGDWPAAYQHIVWQFRFPRMLLALLVGAGLAVVGAVMQTLVRNALADPYLLGISSGASVGAVTVLASGAMGGLGGYAVSVGAFIGALLSFACVFALAYRAHGQIAQRLILAGVAVSYICSGITSYISLSADHGQLAQQVLSWTLGSVARARWQDLGLLAVCLLVGLTYLLMQARQLNAFAMGDETAATLGVDVAGLRRRLFVVASLMTGGMVAVSGAIGFIGLMVPHVCRLLVGSDHRRLLPVSALVGGLILIGFDLLARTLIAPSELPIGVISAIAGGPFFLYLMYRPIGRRAG